MWKSASLFFLIFSVLSWGVPAKADMPHRLSYGHIAEPLTIGHIQTPLPDDSWLPKSSITREEALGIMPEMHREPMRQRGRT